METKFCINKIILSNPEERVIFWDSKQLDWNTEGELTVQNIHYYFLQGRDSFLDLITEMLCHRNQFFFKKHVYLNDQLVEFFEFKFGFVIPGSTNTWQQIIFSAEKMLPKEVLSGNLVVNAKFFDDEDFLCEKKVRIYYI